MGAGKSTAVGALARAIGVSGADVDEVIEQRLGASVQALFARDGEAGFRAAEEQITLELLRAPGDGVVALGGGAVMAEAVRSELARHRVVWLDVTRELAWERCQGGGRPWRPTRPASPLCTPRASPSTPRWPTSRCPGFAHTRWPRCWRRPRTCRPGTG